MSRLRVRMSLEASHSMNVVRPTRWLPALLAVSLVFVACSDDDASSGADTPVPAATATSSAGTSDAPPQAFLFELLDT